MSGEADNTPRAIAEHEAAHVVVALVTMGNHPESVTIEPSEGYDGRRVGRESVASSVAENPHKRRIRRAMTLLAPAVLAAPHDLFALPAVEFFEYFFAPGKPHSQDAKDVINVFLFWWDTPQEMHSIIRGIASRTKVLLGHPLVKHSIADVRDRLLAKPTLYTEDLEDVTRTLMSERQSIMSWLRAQMRGPEGPGPNGRSGRRLRHADGTLVRS